MARRWAAWYGSGRRATARAASSAWRRHLSLWALGIRRGASGGASTTCGCCGRGGDAMCVGVYVYAVIIYIYIIDCIYGPRARDTWYMQI